MLRAIYLASLFIVIAYPSLVWGSVTRLFNEQQGLHNASILAVAEDEQGLMWIATESGIYRLADNILRPVHHPSTDQSLASIEANSLLPLTNGRLLIGTINDIWLFDLVNADLKRLSDLVPGVQGKGTFHLHQDRQGQVWFVDNLGNLICIDAALSKAKVVATLPAELLWVSLWRDFTGDLWVLSKEELLRIDAESGEVSNSLWLPTMGRLKSMAEDAKGQMWFGGSSGLYQHVESRLEKFPSVDFSVKGVQANHSGSLWLLSKDAIWQADLVSSTLEPSRPDTEKQFQFARAHSLLLDSRGTLWLSSQYDGLLGFHSGSVAFDEVISPERFPDMTDTSVWSVIDEGTKRFVATDRSVQWFDLATGEHRAVKPIEGDDDIATYRLLPFDEQHLLLGTTQGLFVMDKQTLIISRIQQPSLSSLDDAVIMDIVKHGDDFLIATGNRLLRWNPATQDLRSIQSSEGPLRGITVLAIGESGRVWAGGDTQLGWLDSNDHFHSFSNMAPEHKTNVSFMLPDGDEGLYYGTFGGGLWYLSSVTGRVESKSEDWAVNCINPYFATKFKAKLLIGCDSQLLVVDEQKHEVFGLDKTSGLPFVNFNQGSVQHSKLGVFVGSEDGVVLIDNDAELLPIQANNRSLVESVAIHFHDRPSRTLLRPQENQAIEIDANYQLMMLQLASNRQLESGPTRFRYRLNVDGKKGQLVELQQGGKLTFSGLSAGQYELEVYGLDRGVWSPESSLVNWSIQEPWYASKPTWAVAFGLIVFLMFLGLVYRERQLVEFRLINRELTQSRQRLHLALNSGSADTWEWERATNSVRFDNSHCFFGAASNTVHISVEDIQIHPDDLKRVYKAWLTHSAGRSERFDIEYRQMDFQGRWRWVRTSGRAVERCSQSKKPLRMVGIYSDLTTHRRLQQEHSLFARAIENTSEGVLILDKNLNIQDANPAAEIILQASQMGVTGTRFDRFWYTEQPLRLDDVVANEQGWRGELSLRRLNGSVVPVWFTVSMMDGSAQTRVVVFSDITERKMAELELRRLADFDTLTGLPNRANFGTRLEREVSLRANSQQPMALMFLDLDRFKHVNDTYGHSFGDSLLQETTCRLQSVLDSSCTISRFGGDEFLVLIPDYQSKADLSRIGQKILETIEKPFNINGQVFYVSTSIGAACWPEDARQAEALIRHADLAMYHAKEEGKGRLCFYSHHRDARATYQLELENALRLALEQDRLELHFQPLVDLAYDRVTGLEALVRWYDDKAGQVTPDRFIALAESSGMIVQLDRWVLIQACKQFLSMTLPESVKLSVNVSAAHFRQLDYVDFVATVIGMTKLDPSRLCLEITEGVLMKQVSLAQSHLKGLRKLGVSVAVDDFGTGYSSLAYLSQFAVDVLKIDRSFVRDLPENATNGAITRSVLDLGRNLGMQVVAEGVEVHTQMNYLRDLGCYQMQGFLFAKPMPADACQKWVKNWSHDESLTG